MSRRDDDSRNRKRAALLARVVGTRSQVGLVQVSRPNLLAYRDRDKFKGIPSLTGPKADTFKKASATYTGKAMLGVATMHKSNTVPVFTDEDAVAIAKMRRG